jgi:predicted GNAT family N-acyltransferase
MEIVIAKDKKTLEDAFKVRKVVFVDEQKVPPEEEIDQYEDESVHFVVYNDNDEPIGAGRLRNLDGAGKIERICVLADYRTCGIGKKLMEKIMQYAKDHGYEKVKLNSQSHAIPFYEKLGFFITSEEFFEAGIPHRTMEKML